LPLFGLSLYIRAHPEIYGWPDPKLCNEQKEDVSPDGKFLVVNDNPCFYSPLGTTVHLYERARMPSPWEQDGAEWTILNIRSGGPIITVWKSPTELLVACRRCRREDVWLMRPRYKDIKVIVRYEAYGEPLPDYQRGELEFLRSQWAER
jgi:hypothetical protein